MIWFITVSFLPYPTFIWFCSICFRQICLSAILFLCGILVALPGIELAVTMLSTKHWTTAEIPFLLFFQTWFFILASLLSTILLFNLFLMLVPSLQDLFCCYLFRVYFSDYHFKNRYLSFSRLITISLLTYFSFIANVTTQYNKFIYLKHPACNMHSWILSFSYASQVTNRMPGTFKKHLLNELINDFLVSYASDRKIPTLEISCLFFLSDK